MERKRILSPAIETLQQDVEFESKRYSSGANGEEEAEGERC